MQRASKLIKANQGLFPDCAYYLPLFSKARRNICSHPDICIETCKSLIEGISKTIILGLDKSAKREDLDKKEVEPLVKSAAKLLKANDDVIEEHFVNRVSGLAHSLGALRNARGDISHGRAVPKAEDSTSDLARLCLQMTDAITFYMLQSFFALSLPTNVLESTVQQSFEEEPLPSGLPPILYEDNPAFNDDLDQRYPLDGKLLYSEALYRLYYEDYVLELESYQDALAENDYTDEPVYGNAD